MPTFYVPYEPFRLEMTMDAPVAKAETRLPEKLSELLAPGLSELRKLVDRGGRIRLTHWIAVPDKLENCEACLAGAALLGVDAVAEADAIAGAKTRLRTVGLYNLFARGRISEQDHRRGLALNRLSKGQVTLAIEEITSYGTRVQPSPLDRNLVSSAAVGGYVGEDWLKDMDKLHQDLVEVGL